MSVCETIKMSPLLGLQGSGGGLAYLAGLSGGDKVYVDDVFSTALYTGNASSNTVPSGLDFTEGSWLSWIKLRDGSDSHFLSDSTQKTGVCFDSLASDRTYGKQTGETTGINAVGTSSYSILGGNAQVNGNTKKYTSWNFKEAPGFFDVVTWTGDGNGTRAIAHLLGNVPGMIIVKCTNNTENWAVYHRSLPADGSDKVYNLELDTTSGQGQFEKFSNHGAQTSSTFSVRTSLNVTNRTYVAYIFAHDDAQYGTGGDESIIKCGSYTATGSLQEIDLGFEPQWVMIKNSSRSGNSSTDWVMFDSMRGMVYDRDAPYLRANSSASEGAGKVGVSATGLVIDEATVAIGTSGDTYIYMAIRRPNKPPTAATGVFYVTTNSTDATSTLYTSGFPVDFHLQKSNGGSQTYASTRLMGRMLFATSRNNAETLYSSTNLDSNTQFSGVGAYGASDGPHTFYAFKRAPSFMDVVTFSGTGSNLAVNHNLDAIPELILHKNRTSATNWVVSATPLYSSGKILNLSSNGGPFGGGTSFMTAVPTASQISLSSSSSTVNASGNNYIQYLFATLPGISKVGTYTGSSGAVNVNCGFTNGARFIMIKRIDEDVTGDWYVWDTANGIVSGNDPYYTINNTAARVTNTDYVDPLSTGFTVTASAPAALNVSGGTYLFLAIA